MSKARLIYPRGPPEHEIVRVGAHYVFNEDTGLVLIKEPTVRFILRRKRDESPRDPLARALIEG